MKKQTTVEEATRVLVAKARAWRIVHAMRWSSSWPVLNTQACEELAAAVAAVDTATRAAAKRKRRKV